MIESHTAILERQSPLCGAYATEPYETAWAKEAIFFALAHGESGDPGSHSARVQISPDGMRWCDEGSVLEIRQGQLTSVKVGHFGGWLRIVGNPGGNVELVLSVRLVLKG